MIKKSWPLTVKIILAPIAIIGALLSGPVILILIAAREDKKADNIMEFWIGS